MKHVQPVWQLKGSTDNVVECYINETSSRLQRVTVVLGSETFLDESYPDASSAMNRATHVRDGLMEKGDWTILRKA